MGFLPDSSKVKDIIASLLILDWIGTHIKQIEILYLRRCHLLQKFTTGEH